RQPKPLTINLAKRAEVEFHALSGKNISQIALATEISFTTASRHLKALQEEELKKPKPRVELFVITAERERAERRNKILSKLEQGKSDKEIYSSLEIPDYSESNFYFDKKYLAGVISKKRWKEILGAQKKSQRKVFDPKDKGRLNIFHSLKLAKQRNYIINFSRLVKILVEISSSMRMPVGGIVTIINHLLPWVSAEDKERLLALKVQIVRKAPKLGRSVPRYKRVLETIAEMENFKLSEKTPRAISDDLRYVFQKMSGERFGYFFRTALLAYKFFLWQRSVEKTLHGELSKLHSDKTGVKLVEVDRLFGEKKQELDRFRKQVKAIASDTKLPSFDEYRKAEAQLKEKGIGQILKIDNFLFVKTKNFVLFMPEVA
ncbi:MAG: hypothetical protein Q7K42_02375, partial [Candidatus Diapherotrites archaeon]|nr:hypothetical protein [Candidatus Diapherotrites archaeon]